MDKCQNCPHSYHGLEPCKAQYLVAGQPNQPAQFCQCAGAETPRPEEPNE